MKLKSFQGCAKLSIELIKSKRGRNCLLSIFNVQLIYICVDFWMEIQLKDPKVFSEHYKALSKHLNNDFIHFYSVLV